MTAKTMSEVLAEHSYMNDSKERYCKCGDYLGDWATEQDFSAHQSAALSAAGFGLVADAKAEAWDEGYDRAESDHYGTGFWTKRLRGNPHKATP